MKPYNYNKRLLYISSLAVALVGLTSFNPFSQYSHLALLGDDGKDESIEMAVSLPTVVTELKTSVHGIFAVAKAPPPIAPEEGLVVGGVISSGGTGKPAKASATNESYKLVNNEYVLIENKKPITLSVALGTNTLKYEITKIKVVENKGHIIHYKLADIPENKSTMTEAGVCSGDLETCTEYIQLNNEKAIPITNLDLEKLFKKNSVATEIARIEATIAAKNTLPKIQPTEVAAADTEKESDLECLKDDNNAQFACLRALKNKVCSRRQEYKEQTENCLLKEEYSQMLQDFVEEVTLDPDVSDRQFSKFIKIASRDAGARDMIRAATQYRSLMKQSQGFERNIDRTLNQVERLDGQIAELEQYAFSNPYAMQQQRYLAVQRQQLISQVENQVEQYKNYYQKSSLGSPAIGRGNLGGFTQSLKSDLESAYAEVVSPISGMFFDQSLASLDRVAYTGVNSADNATTSATNTASRFNLPGTNPNIDTGLNTGACASNDPTCLNGYRTTNNNQQYNGITYNQFDPRMSNTGRQLPAIFPGWRNQQNQQYAQGNNNNNRTYQPPAIQTNWN